MRRYSLFLLTTAALLPQVAYAADDAAADVADAAAADSGDGAAGEIVVFGQGQSKQVQEVKAAQIEQLAPGSSPIRAIEKLPSVNVQSADAFGNYEWSARVTIRSFNQNQLGFTFDGIPLGDMSYGNHNGLHISRIVSPENIASVRVAQGAGAVGTQSTSSLGGTVETFSLEPTDGLGVQVNGTYGSNNTVRAFARVNVGMPNGPRGFVSYAYGTTDKYRGHGVQDQHMVNAKLIVPVGATTIDGWFSYSNRAEQDYQDMSLGMLSRLGYGWDNTAPDYATAILYADIGNNRGETGAPISNPAAGTVYPGNVQTVDDAYFDAAGLRKDTVGALGLTAPVGERAKLAVKWYHHHNDGRGLWATPYVPSPNGVPISMRTTEYAITRDGVFGTLDYDAGAHHLQIGGWWEHNDFNQARRFYALQSRTQPGLSFRAFPANPFYTQWEYNFTTQTLQYHVSDAVDLGALKLDLGWKGFQVKNEAAIVVGPGRPQGTIKATDWFQPHAGLTYKLGGDAELFAGFTQATRAFQSAATGASPFATTQAGFDAIKGTLKPESSDTYELGARYNTSRFNGVVGVYLVNFRNRLLAVSSGPGVVGNPSILQNVGGVRSVGFEAAGDLKLGRGFGLFASYSYSDATYRDDVIDGSGNLVAAIKGKTVVDAPRHMLRGELSYDQGPAFFRIGANYMSKRFFTYTNDQSVPGRVLVDASAGYRLTDKIELQVNATNLFDKQYVATIGSNGFGNSGDSQTLLVGAPQQFFVTLKAGF